MQVRFHLVSVTSLTILARETPDVFTTWSGGVPVDDFIKISEIGFSKGVKIAVSRLERLN